MTFPRLQKRGPIEAMRLAPLATKKDRCFHAYKSVAPLKRHKMSEAKERLLTFPRLQKRGPIEAHSCQPASGLILVGVTQLGPNWVIPTAIYGVFWPITRHMWGSLPANCVSPNWVSTLTKAWPH